MSRLSEIKDIPYPDNLYLLMQSLEGYSRIFKHSHYFQVEEAQVCIDYQGKVKIWVNCDLSINYPNNEGVARREGEGEYQMVDGVIDIICENTDRETEPQLSFM